MDDLITNGNEVIREIRRLLPSVKLVTDALNGDAEKSQKMVNQKQVEKMDSMEELLADYQGRLEMMEVQARGQEEMIKSQAEMIKSQAETIKSQAEKREEMKKALRREKEDMRAKLKKTEQELAEAKKKLAKKEEPCGFLGDLISF